MSNLYNNLAVLACEGWSWGCIHAHGFAPLMAAALAIFCCAWWWWVMKIPKINPPLPPGPLGLPIIGNLPFIQPELHRYFLDLSRIYGPIFKLRLGRMIVIGINSPSLANEVLKDQDAIFANRDSPAAAVAGTFGGLDIAWRSNGPEYNRLRKLVMREIMSKQGLDACYMLRRREVRRMVKEIHKKVGSIVNIDEQLSATALRVMMSTLWGDDPSNLIGEERQSKDLFELRKRLDEFVRTFAAPNLSDLFPVLAPFDIQGIESKAKNLLSWFYGVFESVINNRINIGDDGKEKEKVSKDFMQQLLDLHQRGNDKSSLSITEVKALLLDMMVGGTDTIPTTAEWAMTELLRHPDKMAKLVAELDMVVGNQTVVEECHIPKLIYLDAVIKETLRLHPVVPLLLPHVPSETSIIGGYTIPKDCRVFINAWAMQRDPKLWDDPLRFQPERFLESDMSYRGNNFRYFPFGSGRRICVGVSMAEKMVALLVGSLVHSFQWGLLEGTKPGLEDKFGIVLKKAESLVAIPIARLPNLEQYQ
ncbi:hypothetical protein ES288_D11G008600v1 [Gossypium darwinii]|uniref:Cytochrome P450 n=1 Tax=Gossypium darwinii TaxID=34276 RepID=A0A5D2AG94_GOSDA|nr:hypothetical protein ES288_D11G008600v1 [Gossypium darwinii]